MAETTAAILVQRLIDWHISHIFGLPGYLGIEFRRVDAEPFAVK